MNGLGADSRDSGHSRVPAPPERMTGTSATSKTLRESKRGLYPNDHPPLTGGRRAASQSARAGENSSASSRLPSGDRAAGRSIAKSVRDLHLHDPAVPLAEPLHREISRYLDAAGTTRWRLVNLHTLRSAGLAPPRVGRIVFFAPEWRIFRAPNKRLTQEPVGR